jgi:hypothetical protein
MKIIYLFFIEFCFYSGLFSQSFSVSNPISFDIRKKTEPPILEFAEEPTFVDENGNNIIDANEKCKILFKVLNTGNVDALNLRALLHAVGNVSGIQFKSSSSLLKIERLGGIQSFEIPIESDLNTLDGKVEFTLKVREPMGFDTKEIKMLIHTAKFISPDIRIVDYNIYSMIGAANLELRKPFTVQLLIQNLGQGSAKDILVKMAIPKNVFITVGDELFKIDKLAPGEKKILEYEMVINSNYTNSMLPIKVELTELYGKFAKNWANNFTLKQELASHKILIESKPEEKENIETASLRSDVDINIPINNAINENKFALIIGNEDYSSFQQGLSSEMNVTYAINDASVFKEYCLKTLGVSDKNIIYLINATVGKMSQSLDKIKNLISITGGNAIVYVYYAGHGLSDEKTKEPYIIPVDVNGTDLSSAIKLSSFYAKLTEYPAKQVTVFMDACFSGGGRESGLVYMRGVKVTPKSDYLTGNIVVFTATSGEESSLPWKEKQHGLFTYFLLKKIQESKGMISVSELNKYLKDKVMLESIRSNSKLQSPQLLSPDELIPKLSELKLF